MRRWIAGILGALIALAGLLPACRAQERERWYLRYEQEKPKIYVYKDKTRGPTTWWYFTYKITNPTDQRVPLLVDVQLYVESGKSLRTDTEKVKIETISSVFDPNRGDPHNRPYRQKRFGRFYANVIAPEVEYEIIANDLRLNNRLDDTELRKHLKKVTENDPELKHHERGVLSGNRGIAEESILRFKQKGYFLNPRELRIKGHLQPKETIHGIAIFTDVDPRANIIETHVSGLQDIFTIVADKTNPEELVPAYENRIFVTRYSFRGDAYERARDRLLPPPKRFWITRKIGPIASKETIDTLIGMMIEYVKKEWEWRMKGLTPREIDSFRRDLGYLAQDVHNAAEIFQKALVTVEFGYDRDKSPWENRQSIWRMHEYWLRNKSRLRYSYTDNRYEVFEEALPGHERIIHDR